MIKLIVSGCCGKMGRRIMALAGKDNQFIITGALEASKHQALGKKVKEVYADLNLDIPITDDGTIIKQGDVLIEFTNPRATVEHLDFLVKYHKAVVVGTTGLDRQQWRKVKEAAKLISIVFSPNMSLGVNLVFKLVKQATEKLGQEYKASIIEAHHIHKKDAPSGTAKGLAELIKKSSRGKEKEIKIDSIREGEIVGDHQIRFDGPQDTIVIKHSAKTRDIFAQGALEAAKFVLTQPPGLYDMQDVIRGKKP